MQINFFQDLTNFILFTYSNSDDRYRDISRVGLDIALAALVRSGTVNVARVGLNVKRGGIAGIAQRVQDVGASKLALCKASVRDGYLAHALKKEDIE